MTKPETAKAKLAALFGLEEVHEEFVKKTQVRQGNIEGITEQRIQFHRELTATVYFLQAPELFHPRTCKRCTAPFLVSRLHVAFCSYECLNATLMDEVGINWSRTGDMDLMVKEVYEGNEPLWIRNVWTLQKCLEKLMAMEISQESLLLPRPPPLMEPSLPTQDGPKVTISKTQPKKKKKATFSS